MLCADIDNLRCIYSLCISCVMSVMLPRSPFDLTAEPDTSAMYGGCMLCIAKYSCASVTTCFGTCHYCPGLLGLPYCILFVLVKLQAASSHFTYRLRTQARADSQQEQHGGHKPVCLVPGFVDKYLHVPFKRASNHILRAFNSVDVGINTASCQGPTCFVPELVAGNASVNLT